MKANTTHLSLELFLEFLTFLLLSYPYKTSASLFQIFATALFKWFNTEFSAIFNDFDVTISDWEVLALGPVWPLILITFEFIRGKTTDATVFLLRSHNNEVIILDQVLFVLLDNQAQVFDLSLNWLVNRAWFYYYWCIIGLT